MIFFKYNTFVLLLLYLFNFKKKKEHSAFRLKIAYNTGGAYLESAYIDGRLLYYVAIIDKFIELYLLF